MHHPVRTTPRPHRPVPVLPRTAFALLLLLLASTGCRGDGAGELSGVRLEVAMAPTPPVVGPNRVVVTLTAANAEPVEGASLRLEGTMTHAGMVPVIREAASEGGGRYRVDDFEFTMGGDWILLAHVTLADGRAGTLERQVRVISSPAPADREPDADPR